MDAKKIENLLIKKGNREYAKRVMSFFKTGKGEYGEGDVFLGIKVPDIREIAKQYIQVGFIEAEKLLQSKYHESRLCSLLILIAKFKKANEDERKKIFNLYLKNTKKINNWDLVDLSAHCIVGAYLIDKNKDILYKLAVSNLLWDKRISIISCFAFIKNNDFKDAIKISKILLNDKHDLIHKAVGWVLREIGKKNIDTETSFLNKHYKTMPRTMLRYAIEKFPPPLKLFYMQKLIQI